MGPIMYCGNRAVVTRFTSPGCLGIVNSNYILCGVCSGKAFEKSRPAIAAFFNWLFPPKKSYDCKVEFISDKTFPDGTTVKSESTVLKTWSIRNVGSYPWPKNTSLTYIGPNQLPQGTQLRVNLIEPYIGITAMPGETVDVSIRLEMPSDESNYKRVYSLYAPEVGIFGPRLWIDVNVKQKRCGFLPW